jgi:SAM-dependent methyltransferase
MLSTNALHRPIPESSVDVVISNCVVNLSADKGQVLREAYRVLVPGGRFAVSDIVFQGQIPPALRADLESWAGCIAGALEEETYQQLLQASGFTEKEGHFCQRGSPLMIHNCLDQASMWREVSQAQQAVTPLLYSRKNYFPLSSPIVFLRVVDVIGRTRLNSFEVIWRVNQPVERVEAGVLWVRDTGCHIYLV